MSGKSATRLSPARALALQTTAAVRQRDAYAKQILASLSKESKLSSDDKDFAMLLVAGVVSSTGTLDELIDASLRSPKDIKDDVRDALRISAYEILFLDKPSYVVVDQGVELVRSIVPKAANLANAVLRKMLAKAADFPWGDVCCNTAALARSYAHPLWLCQRFIDDWGRDAAVMAMSAALAPAPVFIAGNPFAGSSSWAFNPSSFDAADYDHRFRSELLSFDSQAQAYGVNGCFRSLRADRILSVPASNAGLVSSKRAVIADASAQLIARLATPAAGERFLEIGAGRGTKTILLQSACLRKHRGLASISSVDNLPFKTELLKKRIAESCIPSVHALCADASSYDFPCEFAGALLDVPCSGSGTLRRHPEQRWRLKEDDLFALANLGLSLLKNCSRSIIPGGFIVFSTCSIFKQENEDVVQAFLSSEEGSDFRIDDISQELPEEFSSCLSPEGYFQSIPCSQGHDGHFACRLVRG